MSSRRSIADLPSAALNNLIKAARGSRCIAGTNKYALVCKSWKDASSNEPAEQLQLYMDLAALTPEQCKAAAHWMAAYSEHIDVLHLLSCGRSDAKTVLTIPDFGSNLQHLELDGPNSLAGLLEAKVQLPALKHLSARLSPYFSIETQPNQQPSNVEEEDHQQPSSAVEQDQQQPSSQGRDPQQSSEGPAGRTQHTLQETCPALVKLEVSFRETSDARAGFVDETLDGFLPRLLPPTLQQLRLRWLDGHGFLGCSKAFLHLTGLQHLELWSFQLFCYDMLDQLPPECTLQLVDCVDGNHDEAPGCWLSLHHRLTALSLPGVREDCAPVAEMTGLTSLTMELPGYLGDQSAVRSLAYLRGLEQLNLSATAPGAATELVEALQHMEEASSLCRLAFTSDNSNSWGLLAALGALTQLTALVWRCNEPVYGQAQQQQQQQQQVGGYAGVPYMGYGWMPAQQVPPLQGPAGGPLQALQHLVGLRQLQLSAPLLINHPTGWLTALTQLTLLAVSCKQVQEQSDTQQQQVVSCVAAVVPRVQDTSPPSLQQVVLYMKGVSMRTVEPSPLPGVSVWVRQQHDWEWRVVPQGPRPMQPCPHLPGVWELLE
jgi:hypothetical protein